MLTDAVAWVSCFLPSKLWKLLDIAVIVGIVGMLRYLFTEKNSEENTLLVCVAFYCFRFRFCQQPDILQPSPTTCIRFYDAGSVHRHKTEDCQGKDSMVDVSCCDPFNHLYHESGSIRYLPDFFLTILLIVSWKNDSLRKVRGLLCLEGIASVLGYAALYFAPGHCFRMNTYGTWIPDYAQWTVGQKLFHGYTATVAYLYYRSIPLLTVFLYFCFWWPEKGRNGPSFYGDSAGIPSVTERDRGRSVTAASRTGTGDAGDRTFVGRKNAGLFLLSILLTASVFIGVWLAVDTTWRKYTILCLLFMGAGSRMAMGFSETLYGSSYRTYSFLLFCVVISVILLGQELREKANDRALGFAWGVIGLEVLEQYVWSLQSLI